MDVFVSITFLRSISLLLWFEILEKLVTCMDKWYRNRPAMLYMGIAVEQAGSRKLDFRQPEIRKSKD